MNFRDYKIQKLIRHFGAAGYGIYKMLCDIYEEEVDAVECDYDMLSYITGSKSFEIKNIIEDFDLFDVKNGKFTPKFTKKEAISKARSEAGKKGMHARWNNKTITKCDNKTLKEKEIIEEEKKESNIKKKIEEDNKEIEKKEIKENQNINILEKENKEKLDFVISVNERKEEKSCAKKEEKVFTVYDFQSRLIELCMQYKHTDNLKQTISDWMLTRKQKRATNSLTALNRIINQIQIAIQRHPYMTPEQCIQICAEHSWIGFDANWIDNISNFKSNNQPNPNLIIANDGFVSKN